MARGCGRRPGQCVGGVRSPLASDGDAVALAEALQPERVVLVADAGRGAINAVRLAAAALAGWPVSVVLNRFDGALDLHQRNRAWLAVRDGLHVVLDGADLVAPVVGWPEGRA
jgi:dethiobiotin synthetase